MDASIRSLAYVWPDEECARDVTLPVGITMHVRLCLAIIIDVRVLLVSHSDAVFMI